MDDTQSQLIAVCPECAAIMKVNFSRLGQNVRCPQCHRTFIAGEAVGSPARPSAEQPAASSTPADEPVERIKATCTGCHATLHVRRKYIGSNVRCKYCDQVFRVLDPAESQPQTPHDEAATQPVPMQAEQQRLYVAHNLLQADHDRLKSEYHELHENLDRVTAELETIRGALGTIAPDEVGALAAERQSLAAEVHRLGEEIHASLAVQAERDQLAAEGQERLSELTVLSAERDLFSKQLSDRDDSLEAARAELERTRVEHQTALAEVERLRQTLAERDDTAKNERERLGLELDNLRREFDAAQQEHRAELDQRDDTAKNERERLGLELDSLRREFDVAQQEHRAELDKRDDTAKNERERLGLELDNLRREFDVARQEYRAELDQRSEPLLPSAATDPAAVDDVDDVRSQLEELGLRLEESEHRNREMAAVLGGMGIRYVPNQVYTPR
jgi:predicted Zn finger-like uncharacterized protein